MSAPDNATPPTPSLADEFAALVPGDQMHLHDERSFDFMAWAEENRDAILAALTIAAVVDHRASLPHFHSDFNGKHSAESVIREAEARLKADGK